MIGGDEPAALELEVEGVITLDDNPGLLITVLEL